MAEVAPQLTVNHHSGWEGDIARMRKRVADAETLAVSEDALRRFLA